MSTLMVKHNGMVNSSAPVVVGNESVTVLRENPRRKYAVIFNENGSELVWLSFGINAEVDRCYPLCPHSYYIIDSVNHTTCCINAISTNTPVTLIVLECQ